MSPFWQFLSKVYDGPNGGWGIFFITSALIASTTTIVKALTKWASRPKKEN